MNYKSYQQLLGRTMGESAGKENNNMGITARNKVVHFKSELSTKLSTIFSTSISRQISTNPPSLLL